MSKKNAFVKIQAENIPVYSPPGHEDTYNRRLIGPSLGANHVEVILGEMGPKGGADAHAHEEFEQVMYMLEGRLRIISPDAEDVFEPGDLVLFPIGVSHQVICETEKARFLVIYAPPREKV